MGKGSNLSVWKKQLNRIENHLAEEAAPEVNKLLKESANFALVDWYNDYDPQSYDRTYNFMQVLNSVRTSGKGNVLTMTIDSGSMGAYPGWLGQKLQPSTGFEYFFMNGYHGYGRWLMHKSIPPFMYIDEDIYSGFGGRINKVINSAIMKILR